MVRLILAFLLIPMTASAQGFITKKSQWDEMNAWAKDAYVAGFIDGVVTPFVGSDAQIKYTGDMIKCISDLNLNTMSLVSLVDLEYDTLENWQYGPSVVLMNGIRRVCLKKMNEYRAARGDALIEE